MYLGRYDFDGDPAALLPAYERLMAGFPPDAIHLHLCLVTTRGLTVLDACPSPEVFAEFSTSDGFARAVRAAGLPAPAVTPLGEVHRAHVDAGVTS